MEQQVALEVQKLEADMKTKCERERDAEIELVIKRLEDEQLNMLRESRDISVATRERTIQMQREIDRLRAEKETTQTQLDALQDLMKQKEVIIAALRNDLAIFQAELRNQQDCSEVDCEKRLHAVAATYESRLAREAVRMQSAVEAKDSEIQQLHQRVNVIRIEKDAALATLEQKHTFELQTVNERVSSTLTRKDHQARVAQQRISELEKAVQERDDILRTHNDLLS